MAKRKPHPNPNVERNITLRAFDFYKKNDWLDLAIAALDQAGVPEIEQKQIADWISEHYDTE